MDFEFEIVDGDSKCSIRFCDGFMQIRRPNKGLSPRLMECIQGMFNEDDDPEDVKRVTSFLGQTENIDVVIGEERCG